MTTAPRQLSRPKPDRAIFFASVLGFLVCCAGWLWLALWFPQTGWDFTGFYLAGNVPLESLYNQSVVQDYGERLLQPLGIEYYPPYVRPDVFSLPMRTVMWLPYWTAFTVCALLQFGLYLGALSLLWRRFPIPVELLIGFGCFYPGMMGIVTGQDIDGVVFVLVLGLMFLLDNKPRGAGCFLALCLYKFNLTLLLPLLLLAKKQYRALAWFCGIGAGLALASAALSPAGEYLTLLRNIPKYTIGFSPGKMIGLRALAHGIGYPPLFYLFAAAVGGLSVWLMWRLPLTEAFCVALMGALLCSYHVTWYDGAVLVIPIVVAFSGRAKAPQALAGPLLFLFPMWPAYPKVVAVLILLLLGAFAIPAFRQKAEPEPAPALS